MEEHDARTFGFLCQILGVDPLAVPVTFTDKTASTLGQSGRLSHHGARSPVANVMALGLEHEALVESLQAVVECQHALEAVGFERPSRKALAGGARTTPPSLDEDDPHSPSTGGNTWRRFLSSRVSCPTSYSQSWVMVRRFKCYRRVAFCPPLRSL